MKLLAFSLLLVVYVQKVYNCGLHENCKDVDPVDPVDPVDENPCCYGYELVEGLGQKHCYRMLIEFGPIMQNQARMACGISFGGSIVTFDKKEDIELVRNHFTKKYHDEIENDPQRLGDTGFWTGYTRANHLSSQGEAPFEHDFIDSYSTKPMNVEFFRTSEPSQPNNLQDISNRSTEACSTRKKILLDRGDDDQGFDDYPCSKPQYAICMLPLVVAGKENVHIYNSRWQNFQEGSFREDCVPDWHEDTENFFSLLIQHAEVTDQPDLVASREALAAEPTLTLTEVTTLARESVFALPPFKY